MVESILVAPGVASTAAMLMRPPALAQVDGQLVIVEHGQNTAAGTLQQPVLRLVTVAALGWLLVQTADEVYVLPLDAVLRGLVLTRAPAGGPRHRHRRAVRR